MTDPRLEIWLKVTKLYRVQMAIITVRDGKSLVSESSLSALAEGGPSDPSPEVSWSITYELMKAYLEMNDFRFWEAREVPTKSEA